MIPGAVSLRSAALQEAILGRCSCRIEIYIHSKKVNKFESRKWRGYAVLTTSVPHMYKYRYIFCEQNVLRRLLFPTDFSNNYAKKNRVVAVILLIYAIGHI